MKNTKRRAAPAWSGRPALVWILCGLIFTTSIALLFIHQKRRLDAGFERMIADSLSTNLLSSAEHFSETVADAEGDMKARATMLWLAGRSPRDFWEGGYIDVPGRTIEYISVQALAEGTLSTLVQTEGAALAQLLRGETVVGTAPGTGSPGAYHFSVILPLLDAEELTGALYTLIPADALLLYELAENVVYQDTQSALITGDGRVLFNTLIPDQESDLISALGERGLSQEATDQIMAVIHNRDPSGDTFIYDGQTYFLSAVGLPFNDWLLASFVRGPDVLLRSADVFRDMVLTSAATILLTAAALCVVFFQLLSSRRALMREQRRTMGLTRRLQAMFDQHIARQMVFDPKTGKILDANPAFCRLFGYEPGALRGREVGELAPPLSLALEEDLSGESGGKTLFCAAPYYRKDGETRSLDAYATIVDDNGRKIHYVTVFDVTEREHYRDALLQEKELLRTTLQSIGDGVVTTDSGGIITSINSVAEKLTGWSRDLAVGQPFSDIFILQSEETGLPVENPIQKVLETGQIVGLANHTELVTRQGALVPIADSAAPIRAEGGPPLGVVMVFRDVSDEKAHSRQVEFLSYRDHLTGLYNRRYIEESLRDLDKKAQLPISVIMADVNGLKITNDVFGHRAGDALLKNVADLIKSACDEGDIAVRWGGDEFVVILPSTDLSEAEALIRKIRDTHVAVEGIGLSLSLSLGCATKATAEDSIYTALQEAEEAMYHQKLLDGKSYRNAIITTLLATLYEKSHETQEHSKRIEKHCHDIGRRLGLSSREMDELSLLALLHDIGKVSIDPNILQKPGPLTPAEWEEMKRHPEIGHRIAQATAELVIVSDLILSHHEHWDGTGYPRRLVGTDIPLACRILAVADAFDAMTNDRVYKSAMTVDAAITELQNGAGQQFDPQITALFIKVLMRENSR